MVGEKSPDCFFTATHSHPGDAESQKNNYDFDIIQFTKCPCYDGLSALQGEQSQPETLGHEA